MTAYVTAHLNVDGDVYAEAAAVSEIQKSCCESSALKVILFSLSGSCEQCSSSEEDLIDALFRKRRNH